MNSVAYICFVIPAKKILELHWQFKMIRIAIADDHALIREGIKNLLSRESDFKIVSETSDPFQVVELLKSNKCDVLILDLSMPQKSGLDVLKEVKAALPETKVLIMTILPEEQFAKRTLKAGASGYITKDASPEEMLTAIRKVASGRKYISASLAEKLAFDLDETTEKEPHEILSDREFQVLRLLMHGRTQSEIAEELFISISSVNTYRSRILEKLNLNSNAELIHYAYRHKLID